MFLFLTYPLSSLSKCTTVSSFQKGVFIKKKEERQKKDKMIKKHQLSSLSFLLLVYFLLYDFNYCSDARRVGTHVFSLPFFSLHGIITRSDRDFINRALALASRAKRKTFPNPCVGCVIVGENGTVIGEGWHERAGEPHAEVKALQDMRKRGITSAENATVYVTLEPCNHYGRTPPCTMSLIR